jgi:adenosylcobinamide-GDP ribazoletransferase
MQMLRAEFGYFLGAVQFLTRLPVPHLDGFAPEWLDRSVKYFPLAGILVGAICAAVLLAASTLWSGVMPALLAVAAGMAATGAFHEDGFGDFFDAMGGATRESRLAIMKDSRLGTFGSRAWDRRCA